MEYLSLKKAWSFIASVCLYLHYVTGEMFSSMADVETLMETEKLVLLTLRSLLNFERQKLADVLRYKQLRRDDSEGATHRLDFSVQRFQMLMRRSRDSGGPPDSAHADIFTEALHSEHYHAIQNLRTSRAFPGNEDIEGSADAFVRLQTMYQIHPKHIVMGRIPGTRHTIPFSSDDAYLVGYHHAMNQHFSSAAAWLEAALAVFHEEKRKTGRLSEILDWLQYAIYKNTGNVVRALDIAREIEKTEPLYSSLKTKITYYEDAIRELTEVEMEAFAKAPNATEAFDPNASAGVNGNRGAYEALCRGEPRLTSAQQRLLRCYYETYSNPFLLIQPVKVELANSDPEVLILHNIMSDFQATRIRKVGQERMLRARVVDGSEKKGGVSTVRIAKTAFLPELLDPVIAAVNRYIGHAVNLDTKIAEDLQINNYGIGGHYLPHYDFFANLNNVSTTNAPVPDYGVWGDRLATVLAYMTDVESGGATVFPLLNLTLFPEKGAAVFWYNKYRDGTPDRRTLHAGCPVLTGTKWVSNKWIREVGQDRHRPCGLIPDGFPDQTSDALISK